MVQELFLSLIRSRQHLRGVENLPAYLFASLYRLVAQAARRRHHAQRLLSGNGDQVAVLPLETSARNLREQLDVALRKLPVEQREVVVMKIDGELTFAEIAAVLAISPNTAASRYRYALEKLRDLLADNQV